MSSNRVINSNSSTALSTTLITSNESPTINSPLSSLPFTITSIRLNTVTMHWTTLALLPLLSTASSLRTTRVTTKFTPDCSPEAQIPGDLDLDEEFIVSLNVRPGVCQGVPVPLPLGFFNEVDHISFEFEPLNTIEQSPLLQEQQEQEDGESTAGLRHYGISGASRTDLTLTSREQAAAARANLEVCTVRLFERPGCSDYDKPLLQREFGAGAGIGGHSQCAQRTRELIALEEVFVKVDCVDGSRPHPTPVGVGKMHGNVTVAAAQSSGIASSTPTPTPSPSPSPSSMGRWQKRRLSLLNQ
ncbi:hypothetical protein BDV18DRAFT_137926 [Aspergillus unguis]